MDIDTEDFRDRSGKDQLPKSYFAVYVSALCEPGSNQVCRGHRVVAVRDSALIEANNITVFLSST